jgi:hypothetical protein
MIITSMCRPKILKGNTYSVEWHIVFSHKLIQLNILRILPPLLPIRSVARSNGDISNRSIKPNIEHLPIIQSEVTT